MEMRSTEGQRSSAGQRSSEEKQGFENQRKEPPLNKYLWGRVCRLPAALGSTVYTNTAMRGWYFRKEDRPYQGKVVFYGINGEDNFLNVEFGNGRMMQFAFSEIGKNVFLTKAEAIQALANTAEEEPYEPETPHLF